MRTKLTNQLLAITSALALSGCLGGAPSGSSTGGTGGTIDDPTGTGSGSGSGSSEPAPEPEPAPGEVALASRTVDYGQALRTAALKLLERLPTLEEQKGVTDAASYAAQIDKYLADPAFAGVLLSYFQDMMKMGGTLAAQVGNQKTNVSLDTAPAFATELVIKDRPFTDLFTATSGTCPTLDVKTGNFTDADCPVANGLSTVGVLTNPGAMAQFYSNMAFRRVRWVQETFVCTKFPTEYSPKPVAMGAGQYVSPWPFGSVTGGDQALVNFQDTSSVVCANCHSTMNHIAPLFANFNAAGAYQNAVQVITPVPNNPTTKLVDWLPDGEQLSWRFQKPVKDLTELGAAIAADPDVADCQVARAWNWAMSKTDIVETLATVPASVIAPLEAQFQKDHLLKPILKAIFTGEDFVKF